MSKSHYMATTYTHDNDAICTFSTTARNMREMADRAAHGSIKLKPNVLPSWVDITTEAGKTHRLHIIPKFEIM